MPSPSVGSCRAALARSADLATVRAYRGECKVELEFYIRSYYIADGTLLDAGRRKQNEDLIDRAHIAPGWPPVFIFRDSATNGDV